MAITLTDTLVGQGRFSLAKSVDDAGLGSPATFAFQWWVDDVQQSPDLVVASDGTVLGPIDVAPDSVVELVEVPPADPARRHLDGPTWTVTGGADRDPQHGGFAFTVGRAAPSARSRSPTWSSPTPSCSAASRCGRSVAAARRGSARGSVHGTWSCSCGRVDRGVLRRVVGCGRRNRRVRRVPRRDGDVAEDADQPGGAFTSTLSPAGGRVVVAAGEPAVVGLVAATNTYADPSRTPSSRRPARTAWRAPPWRPRSRWCWARC